MDTSQPLQWKENRLLTWKFFPTYLEKHFSYDELLEKDGSLSLHHKNIHKLAFEMFNVKIVLASKIVKYIFVESNEKHYNLSYKGGFRRTLLRTIYHSSESISFLGLCVYRGVNPRSKIPLPLSRHLPPPPPIP